MSWSRLAYPVTAEVYVRRLLSRAQMRKLCERFKMRGAILAVLACI